MKKFYFLTFLMLMASDYALKAQFTSLFSFNGTNGDSPFSSLVLSGNFLYGTTYWGGTNNGGVVFKIQKDDSTSFHKLIDFNGTNGRNPIGSLIISGNTLYGMTVSGSGSDTGGIIYKVRTDGTGFTKLHTFSLSSNPIGALTISGNMLYGATAGDYYYASNNGYIFKIDTNGAGFTHIHDFNSFQGRNPNGSLLILGDTLYGTTYFGGTTDKGVLYKINANGSGYKILFYFIKGDTTKIDSGYYPMGPLVLSGNTLYGTTFRGGKGSGVIFKINTDGTDYSKLSDINGSWATVNVNPPQNTFFLTLSGTVLYGIDNGIFQINTDGTGYKKLLDFNGGFQGYPFGPLTISGTTFYGMSGSGASYKGLIYKFHPVPATPAICMVLYDSVTAKNKIVWEKPVSANIIRYKIYKEVKTNQYQCFDSIPYNQLSAVIDLTSNPGSYANKYKISLVDTSGAESALSHYHKPLHIIVNSGNISWYSDDYIDESGSFSPDLYYIYRGRTTNTMICIDSIPGSVQSYTDTKYPGGTMYYQLGIPMPACEPTGILKAGNQYSQSFSNVIVVYQNSINPVSPNDVVVFPNLTTGIVNLAGDNILNSEVFDITGRSQGLYYGKQIDLSSLPAGTYILNVYGKEGLLKKEKIILTK